MTFITNIKTAFNAEHEFDNSAGFVDDLLMMAGLALAALAVVNWIGGAAMDKGDEIANCIEGTEFNSDNELANSECTPAR